MDISISPELEKFVDEEVRRGAYSSASEMVRIGLRRLKEEKEGKPRFMVSSRVELKEKLMEGINELDRGEGMEAAEVFAELRERSARRREGHG